MSFREHYDVTVTVNGQQVFDGYTVAGNDTVKYTEGPFLKGLPSFSAELRDKIVETLQGFEVEEPMVPLELTSKDLDVISYALGYTRYKSADLFDEVLGKVVAAIEGSETYVRSGVFDV